MIESRKGNFSLAAPLGARYIARVRVEVHPATAVLVLSTALALFALTGCEGGQDPAKTLPAATTAVSAYIGREACRDCHLSTYNSFVRTGMGRSFSPLGPDNTFGEFSNAPEFTEQGLTYRMFERDQKFFMQEYAKDSAGRPLALEEHELIWVVGSNNHGRTYLIERDGKLFQAPVCWYPQETTWALCPGFERMNEHFTREISQSCMFCHNGVMPAVAGRRNIFEQPYPHGIGCERCHGPGEKHVERWNSDEDFGHGSQDPTIVNPSLLPAAERQQVCFQCHLGDANQTERIIRHDREPESFRPGELITSVFVPFRFVDPTEYDFGLSSQADRMILSACYTQSDGQLGCLTCHDPHVPVADHPAGFYSLACQTCHEVEDCGEAHNAREAAGNDCVSCHMRRAEPDDQRFSEFTDHWIRRDIAIDAPDPREGFDIEPIFPQQYAALTTGQQAYYRARALTQMSDSVPARERPAMIAQATRLYGEAIEEGYDTTDSRYQYGKSLLTERRFEESTEQFEAVLGHDPDHRDALFALGQYHEASGDRAQAIAMFDRILASAPDTAMAIAERGRILFDRGEHEQALALYREALNYEPWNVTFHINVGMSLAATGRMEEAAVLARSAAQLDPDAVNVWQFNANVLRETGDERGAAEARLRLEELQRR